MASLFLWFQFLAKVAEFFRLQNERLSWICLWKLFLRTKWIWSTRSWQQISISIKHEFNALPFLTFGQHKLQFFAPTPFWPGTQITYNWQTIWKRISFWWQRYWRGWQWSWCAIQRTVSKLRWRQWPWLRVIIRLCSLFNRGGQTYLPTKSPLLLIISYEKVQKIGQSRQCWPIFHTINSPRWHNRWCPMSEKCWRLHKFHWD